MADKPKRAAMSRWSEEKLQAAGLCGSKRVGYDQSRRRCTQAQYGGSKRCWRHGGYQSSLNPDDPRRGGNPVTTGLEVKSPAYVTKMPESAQQAYRDAELDGLETEIRVATAMMVKTLEDWAKNPAGGVTIAGGRDKVGNPMGIRIMPYPLLVMEMTERLRKLKVAYTELLDRKDMQRAVNELKDWARNWRPRAAEEA